MHQGKGGQKFIESCVVKVEELRQRFPFIDIQVDGGVGPGTVGCCAKAGPSPLHPVPNRQTDETKRFERDCGRYRALLCRGSGGSDSGDEGLDRPIASELETLKLNLLLLTRLNSRFQQQYATRRITALWIEHERWTARDLGPPNRAPFGNKDLCLFGAAQAESRTPQSTHGQVPRSDRLHLVSAPFCAMGGQTIENGSQSMRNCQRRGPAFSNNPL